MRSRVSRQLVAKLIVVCMLLVVRDSVLHAKVVKKASAGQNAPKAVFGVETDFTDWWKELENETLNSLIERLVDSNFDVQIARNNLNKMRAIKRKSLAALLPSMAVEGSVTTTPYSTLGNPAASSLSSFQGYQPPDYTVRTSVMANVSLDVDFLGKNYSNFAAASYQAKASQQDYCSLLKQMTAQLIKLYLDLQSNQEQEKNLEQQIETNSNLLEVVENRFNQGNATALDVLQQRQQTAASEARMPVFKKQKHIILSQLATLLNQDHVQELSHIDTTLPLIEQSIALKDVDRLAETSNGMKAALARKHAAQQSYTFAWKSLLPSLRIGGQAGYQGAYTNDYGDELTWSANALLRVPLWSGGASWANVRQLKADYNIASIRYKQQLKTKVETIKQNLRLYQEQLKYVKLLGKQLKLAKQAADEGLKRYLQGIDTYINVYSALISHYQTDASYIQAKRDLLNSYVDFIFVIDADWGICSLRSE